MKAIICDCCGNEVKDTEGLVNVTANFLVVKRGQGNRSSAGEFEFHFKCFQQCFNTFIDSESKCFTDIWSAEVSDTRSAEASDIEVLSKEVFKWNPSG